MNGKDTAPPAAPQHDECDAPCVPGDELLAASRGQTLRGRGPDGSTGRSRWLVAGLAALAALPVVVGFGHVVGTPWLPTSDSAFIELGALSVPRHLPLYGVYSRFGFHHPGPAEFLALAAPLRLFGSKGLLVGATVLNLGCVLALVGLFARRGGLALAALGTFVLLVLERSLAGTLFDPWNPWICVLPFALVIVLGWSVCCRDWWALVPLVALASFVVQAHLGYLPLAGVVLAGATTFALVSWVRGRRARPPADESVRGACPARVLVLTAAVAVVLWLPPLVQQVTGTTGDPGNVGQIVAAMRSPVQPTVGPGAATGGMAREVGVTAPWVTGSEPSYAGVLTGASPWALVPVILVAIGALALARAAGARDAVRLQLGMGLLVVVGWLTMSRIEGANAPYLVRWTWDIAAFLWLSTLWCLWCWYRGRARATNPSRPGRNARAGRSAAPIGVAAATAVAVLAMTVVSAVGLDGAEPSLALQGRVTAVLADAAHDAVRGRGPVLLVAADGSLHEVSDGLLAELQRRGDDVLMPAAQAFYVGRPYVASDVEPAWVLTVASGDQADQRIAKHQMPFVTFDALSPSERGELADLRRRAAPGASGLGDDERTRLTELRSVDVHVALFLAPAPRSVPRPGG